MLREPHASLARDGSAVERAVIRDAFHTLGRALTPWVCRFRPTVVVFGGGMSGAWDLIEPPVAEGLNTAGVPMMPHLVRARTRILTRAVVIFALGGALNIPTHNVAVILEYYAVLFVLILPFLAWSTGRLFGLAAALTVIMPPLYIVLENLRMRELRRGIALYAALLAEAGRGW